MLNDSDLKYIVKKLAVSPSTLKKLMEEEKDVNLVLDAVSIKAIKKGDALKIAPLTYIKLIVFRYSHDSGFDINERDYVAKSVYNHYPSIKNCPDFLLIKKEPISEKRSQYLLILSSFFQERIPLRFIHPDYKKEIEDGFKLQNILKDLPKHSQDWGGILMEIHKKDWLSTVENIERPQLLLKN